MRQHHGMSADRWRAIAAGAAFALVATSFTSGPAFADDGGGGDPGQPVSKSMSHEGNPTTEVEGYINENEHAFIQMMKFYVPMQTASGLTGDAAPADAFTYYNVDGEIQDDTRDLAKPLISVYLNGPVEGVEGTGFTGHGLRDAYGAVSLDDGVTWKNTNLSESASASSSDVTRTDVPLFSGTDFSYPGDVSNIFHAVAGNKVLVAWQSRFCSSGQPSYSLDTDEPTDEQTARREAIAGYLGIDLENASADDLYLIDMFKVSGSQGSVDYAEDKWEQNWPVGEVPFNCLWTARGELVQGDDPRTDALEESYMRWFKAERLTSGRRDVNRIETMCVEGAGCAITWQEDPDGLRPGQGEGPGEGWSGAIANSQTDVWYSYIDWEHFDVVQDPAEAAGDVPMAFLDYEAAAVDTANVTQKPKPFVPFAMPMRMTDNAKCNPENPAPYCIGTETEGLIENPFPDSGATTAMEFGLKDMCADLVQIPTGRTGELKDTCVTEDGLPLVGNTASSRPRLGLYGYDSTGEVMDAVIDNAFVVVVAEEDKGLGAFGFYEDGTACTPTDNHDEVQDPDCIPFDEGKNMWYYSFGMSLSDDIAEEADGLLASLAFHGNMLNQPEVSWETGEFYPVRNTADMWDFGDYNFDIYNTEIARRGSLLAQDIAKVHKDTSEAKAKDGLLALPTWKQGAMNQGGPADVMSRRIVMEKRKWELDEDGNPYAFRNMECTTWAYADGSNPNYPDGLCLDSAINLSATIPDTCVDTDTGETTDCPAVDLDQGTAFGIGDTNPILQGKELDDGDDTTKDSNTDKVLTWHQCPASFTTVSSTDGTEIVTCDNDARTDDSTLSDQSWYNPLEVAKGHRGFLDGDFVMMLYAWSPNWRLNAKGSDRYELYIRRSFDGAETWTTLPKGFTTVEGDKFDGDGTVTCETYRSAETGSDKVEPRACNEYGENAAEQARNVTQMSSMRTTTLDPRYAPTAGSITADPFAVGIPGYVSGDGDSEDVRDPSRYFIAFETGDNTTTAEGEPEPLDLFYSRAINFGDDYVVWADEGALEECYPSDPHDDIDPDTGVPVEIQGSGFCNEFDQLDRGTPGVEASEASLTANPGGEFMYGAWAQLEHDDSGELIDSDAQARRVWWIDGFTSETYDWVFGQGTGDGVPATSSN